HSAGIGRVITEIEFGIHYRALPLADITLAVRLEGVGQILEYLRSGALVAAATCDGYREFPVAREIDFSRESDVAPFCAAELPIHFEIGRQILPAIAGANVADRPASKTGAASGNHVNVFALCVDQCAGADFKTPPG